VDSRSIQVALPGRTDTFSVDEVDLRLSSPDSVYFAKNDSDGELLTVLRLTAPYAAGVTLSYARYGTLTDWKLSPDSKLAQFVFGTETENDDMPRTGSANYNAVLNGVVLAAVEGGASTGYYYLNDVNASFTADFGNMSVATALLLPTTGGTGTNGENRDFGSLAGVGTIAASGPGFMGSFTTPDVVGSFTGAFFGPNAVEMGYVFHATAPDYYVSGNVFGEKDPFPPPPPPP